MSDNKEHIILDATVFVAETDNEVIGLTDGATHTIAVAEIQKLIEQTKNVFELTIKTIPHNDKDCLVTFNKLDKRED